MHMHMHMQNMHMHMQWHAHDMHVHVCMYAHENVLASRLHACSTCCLLTCLQTCTRTDLHICTLAHLHTYEGDQAHPAPRAEPVGGSHQVRKPCRRRCRAHPAALRGVCLAPAVLRYILDRTQLFVCIVMIYGLASVHQPTRLVIVCKLKIR